MPTISSFYGILIQLFWREHGPPHFHALYAEHEEQIAIHTLEIIEGSLTLAPDAIWHELRIKP